MVGHYIRVGLSLGAMGIVGMLTACSSGGSGSSSPSASPASYADMVGKLDSPSGTVTATSVSPVADEFEKVTSSGLGGYRQVKTTQDVSAEMCTAGGSASASGTGSESAGNVTISYNACCMEASCCVNGTVGVVYSSDTSSASKYSQCMDMDVSFKCDNTTGTIKSASCMNSSGEAVYSIEVTGESYTVSGYYSNGTGELTIVGANGTWVCTYTNHTGSCTGTGGDFTF